MNCRPDALARAAVGFTGLTNKRLQSAQIYAMCAWAHAGSAPPCTLPTAPIDLGASAATGNVVLTWPAGVGATGYNIKRALVPGGPYTVIGTSVASPYTDTTGVSGTAYYYVVSSTNACGESAGNSIESHATPVYASFLVTTTGINQVLTIAQLTVSSAMTVDWGDTQTNSYSGAGARTHTYAVAGTYTVRFLAPLLVTVLALSDAKVTLNSAQIKPVSNVGYFELTGIKAGTFNSADVSNWRPNSFSMYIMPAGYAGTFNSADVSAWTPSTQFYVRAMPAGYAGTFNTADTIAWKVTTFRLDTMPTATFTIIVSAGGFAAWTTTTMINMSANALTQAQVDRILTDTYTAFATRTATGGSITLSGAGNSAPSGIFQAQCPPVTGKEHAFELLNDSCLVNPTKKWSTVTTN